MSSSTRCSSERRAVAAVAAVLLGCSHAPTRDGGTPPMRVAMFPAHDLARAPEAAEPLVRELEEAFALAGLDMVSEPETEAALGRHRFRWVGGVDAETAKVLRDELEADAVLITAIEGFAPGPAPLLSLSVRLVSVGDPPRILWVGGFSRTGGDSRGLLGFGVIRDPARLYRNAASELGQSLGRFLRGEGGPASHCSSSKTFAPQFVHRSDVESEGRPRVAVLPFLNRAGNENAGEVLALEFLGQLQHAGRFEVVDPGVVRSVLLDRRIVLRGGVSFDEATSILDSLAADLVLSGEVREYEEEAGQNRLPSIDFTARLMDRDRNVIWQSLSRNAGGDRVRVFDIGSVRTAAGLACRMAAGVVADMSKMLDVAAEWPSKTSGQAHAQHAP